MKSAPFLAAVFLSIAPACRSAPAPLERSAADGPVEASEGLPEEWLPWLGFDEWETPTPTDWRTYLASDGGTVTGVTPFATSDGSLFEIVQRRHAAVRRWHVLVRSAAVEDRATWRLLKLTREEAGAERVVSIPVVFQPVTVAVAPEGGRIGPAREAEMPLVSSGAGYTVGADDTLTECYEELVSAGAGTPEVRDRLVAAWSEPATTLTSLFEGIQAHPELSDILREVVDAPGVLAVLLRGGLTLTLRPDLSAAEACDCPIGAAATRPGVRFPATLLVNDELALEMEIFAVPSTRPVHLTGGLVGLRAWRPGARDDSVELRIVGARRPAPDG